MDSFLLSAENISKFFGKGFKVFENLNISIQNQSALAITGSNGSGKSTLLKVLALISKPNNGNVSYKINNTLISSNEIFNHIGFVAPYLNLYEEFTPSEHFRLFAKIRGISINYDYVNELFNEFKIYKRKDDAIRTFSSGMKQRIKYISAMLYSPKILMLDEPGTNLDSMGIDTVNRLVEKHISTHGAVIIASNDERETSMCKETLCLSN